MIEKEIFELIKNFSLKNLCPETQQKTNIFKLIKLIKGKYFLNYQGPSPWKIYALRPTELIQEQFADWFTLEGELVGASMGNRKELDGFTCVFQRTKLLQCTRNMTEIKYKDWKNTLNLENLELIKKLIYQEHHWDDVHRIGWKHLPQMRVK